MDTPDVYPDVLGDALSHSSQRLAQLGSLITAAATMQARHTAQDNTADADHSQRELRALHEQQHAERQAARTRWAPAHDARWLGQADLLQAARAWGAAVAYADADPAAGSALRKCEERLRVLHPYAMARYDRLRSEGAGAVEAMRQAVPLFGRAPHARPGEPGAERRGLAAPGGSDHAWREAGGGDVQGPGLAADMRRQAEERGHRIVQQLQARALAEHGHALSSDELATALGATTTLHGDVIARLAHTGGEDRMAAGAEAGPGDGSGSGVPDQPSAHVSGERTAAQLAAESFPCTAADAVLARGKGGAQAGRSGTRTVAPRRIGQSGGPM